MKILIIGASGMLGNAVLRVLGSSMFNFDVYGTVRSDRWSGYFPKHLSQRLICGVDALDEDQLISVLAKVRPDAVINCVGVIKQLDSSKNPLATLPLNALFPHRLAALCELIGARMVHISTDCVFNGNRGDYREEDVPDARDLYGLSKHLGEVDYPHAVTLRTSIIGHELGSALSLIDWFLSQNESVEGFQKAIFSGLPTNELAKVIGKYVLPDPSLTGLYHVSADAISKYDLLRLVSDVYRHPIVLRPSDRVVIDRSLNSSRFRSHTGYCPPGWLDLIRDMYLSKSQLMSV